MKINFLWDEEKTRILLKKHLTLVVFGSIPSMIYGILYPGTIQQKIVLSMASFSVILVSLASLSFVKKFKNPGKVFLLNILLIQLATIINMTYSGGLSSILQFVPYALLFITVFQLGANAALVLSVFTCINLIIMVGYLFIQQPLPKLVIDFLLYFTIYVVLTIIFRNIGYDLSLQIEAKKKLEEVDDLKNQFIALTSHYLRTPLTVIKASTSQIYRPESVANIRSSVISLEGFIEKLLTIASIERGEVTISPFMSDLDDIVKATVFDFEPVIKKLKITLNYNPSTPPLPRFSFDPNRIKQCISILIDNGVRYNHPGGVVNVSIFQENAMAIINVSDNGVGISPEDLELVFQAFNKGGLDRTLQLDSPGFGLSLYLAKILVEAHGGKISATSALNQGSTFTISLPIRLVISE